MRKVIQTSQKQTSDSEEEKLMFLQEVFLVNPFPLGQRKGADDNRYLWPHMLRAIHEIRPDWVVGENVAGILSMVQPGQETEVEANPPLFGERACI